MYYIYRHTRLDKNEPFYIGKGTQPRNASCYSIKYKRAYEKSNRSIIWKRIAAKTNFKVEIMYETNNEEDILKKEIEFIALYGRICDGTGTLSNITIGGEGVTGYIPTKEHKQKLSVVKMGKNNPNSKPMSDAHKNKIRESQISKETYNSKKVICSGVVYISSAEASRQLLPDINIKTGRTNIIRAIKNNRPYKNFHFQWLVE